MTRPIIAIEMPNGSLERLLETKLSEEDFAFVQKAFERGDAVTIQVRGPDVEDWKYMVSIIKRIS